MTKLREEITKIIKSSTGGHVDLNYRDIIDEEAILIAEDTAIKSLNLDHNKIGYEGVKAFAKNTTLTSLSFYNNKIGIKDEGAIAIAKNTTLTSLNLFNNGLSDRGIKAIFKNTNLTSLNLDYNKIGDEGATALAENTTLTSLRLTRNVIGNVGAKALAKNNNLTSLNLENNSIGDEGARAFIDNTTLISLDLSWNGLWGGYTSISYKYIQEIEKQLDKNKRNINKIAEFIYNKFANQNTINHEKQEGELAQKSFNLSDACKFREYQKVKNKASLDNQLTALFLENIKDVTPEIRSNVKKLVNDCKHKVDSCIKDNYFLFKGICIKFNDESPFSWLSLETIIHIVSYIGEDSLLHTTHQ